MFKICVVGCGYMAKEGHGPAYAKYAAAHEGVILAGCCDLDRAKAEEFQQAFGFQKAYTDYGGMLDEMQPDVVCLLSSVQATCPLALGILKRGFALLLEKPPGKNREEIEAINRQAEEKQLPVRTAFNRRYTPLILKMKQMMSGEKIYHITYQMYRYNRRDADFSTTAIHAIDAVKYIAGADYAQAGFHFQELPQYGDQVANVYLQGQMENGIAAQITLVPMGNAVVERITVNTDQATYFVELPFWKNPDSPGHLRRVVANQVTDDISGADLVDRCEMFEESGFYEENRIFFDQLRHNAPRTNDLPSAIQSVEMADCIRRRIPEYRKK